MSPTGRSAGALVVIAVVAALVHPGAAAVLAVMLVAAIVIDARIASAPPSVEREVARILPRGHGVPLRLDVDAGGRRVEVRQVAPEGVVIDPDRSEGFLDATVTAGLRGRHPLAPVALRVTGPLGLARWDHEGGGAGEIEVYPDVVAARRLAVAVRTGRFSDAGRRTRGPLGLGTDFESIREYTPDDDIRQVNWRATARVGRPMSNNYRVEQDRDVVCLLDCGRLMSAPLDERTRLDAAVDAVAAMAAVADVVGDHCGVLAFDDHVLRRVRPRRAGGAGVVEAVYDLQPSGRDTDFELAFRLVGGSKRSFVLVLTDLLDPSAAAALVDAAPLLSRRHALAVASTRDPDLDAYLEREPLRDVDAYAAVVARDVLAARRAAVASIVATGADVIEADPDGLGAACVGAYLRSKSRARI